MAKDSIIISSTAQGGKKLQKTITNVNPEATNANLETFAQMFNGLSTNDYGETNRVKKQLTTEPDGTSKTEPTLTVGSDGAITYNGDGELFVEGDYNYIHDNTVGNDKSASFSGKVHATEGTNYAAKSVSFSNGG